jgi:uncharacterized glyoxalase superfamily protein PhnB
VKAKFTSLTPIFSVSDLSKSIEFYTDTLGFQLDFIYGEPQFYAGLFKDSIELHLVSKNLRQHAGSGNLSILTDEVDDLHQKLIEAKVQIIVPPDDRDYGLRDFSCKDLDGNIIVFGTDIN